MATASATFAIPIDPGALVCAVPARLASGGGRVTTDRSGQRPAPEIAPAELPVVGPTGIYFVRPGTVGEDFVVAAELRPIDILV